VFPARIVRRALAPDFFRNFEADPDGFLPLRRQLPVDRGYVERMEAELRELRTANDRLAKENDDLRETASTSNAHSAPQDDSEETEESADDEEELEETGRLIGSRATDVVS
jgi:regulator of replication initiation timing